MMMSLPVFASGAEISDMPGDYSAAALEAAVANGLMSGDDGKILPDNNLTRAQMATIITRAFGAVKAADLSEFTDIKADDWFYDEMGKAVQMKVFGGDNRTLRPNDPITRQEAFAVLARALKLGNGTAADLAAFADKNDVDSWAVGTVAAMVKSGYVGGADGRLNPKTAISRKDFAVMMNNIFKNYIKTAGAVTELAEGSVIISVPGVTLKDVTVKGNLIIGDGVGDGNVTLDNVKVEGTTIVRGGGVNSIIIKSGSSVGKIVVSKVDGNVRVFVESGADVEVITVSDGKDDVIVEGNVDKLEVAASQVPVVVKNGTVGEVAVTAGNASLTLASGAKVETVTAVQSAEGAKIEVAKGATVNTVNAAAAGTEIKGEGSVKNANVTANDVNIATPGTEVAVGEGVTGAKSGDKELKPGETTKTGGGTPSSGGNNDTPSEYPKSVSITTVPEAGDYVTVASQTQTSATSYVINLSGSVPLFVDVDELFGNVPEGKNYAVIMLEGAIPVGESSITQKNPALEMYVGLDSNVSGNPDSGYTKSKSYNKDTAQDLGVLVGTGADTITVEVTAGDVMTTYTIHYNLTEYESD